MKAAVLFVLVPLTALELLTAAEVSLDKAIDEQIDTSECDLFDWFRSCKQKTASGKGYGAAGFITNGSRDTAEYMAKTSARDQACDEARAAAKKKVPPCDAGCYTKFFVLGNCVYSDEIILSGEGEVSEWFEACRLKYPHSAECDSYNPQQQFWAVVKVRASAEVSRLCLKRSERC